MEEHQAGCIVSKCCFSDFAGMHFCSIDCSPEHVLDLDNPVTRVEEDAPKDFMLQVRAVGLKEARAVAGVCDLTLTDEPGQENPFRRLQDAFIVHGQLVLHLHFFHAALHDVSLVGALCAS